MSKRKLIDDGPDAEDRGAKLVADLTALNKEFSSWVSSSAKDKLGYFWEKACEDYIAHAKKLREEYAEYLNPSKKPLTESPKPASPVAAPAPTPTPAPAASTPMIFGGTTEPTPTTSSPPATTFSFGTQPASQPTTSLFGVAASSAPAATTTPTFSAGTSGFGGFSSTGFNFSSSTTATFGLPASAMQPAQASGGEDADGGEGADETAEEEDGGEKFDGKVEKDDKTTVLFNEKATVHISNKEGGWERRGTGALTVRQAKDAKPFVMLSTDAGRMLMMAVIPKNCKPQATPVDPNVKTKARKLMTSLAVVDDDQQYKLKKVIMALANEDKRDELIRLMTSLGAQ